MAKPTINWTPEKDKMACTECGARLTGEEVGKVTDPIGGGDWLVCPECRMPEHLVSVCDYPGCQEHWACGTPTTTVYVGTCSKHKPRDTED